MITTGQPNDNMSLIWPQYSFNSNWALVPKNNITTSMLISVYPKCDVISNAQIKAFGDYLSLRLHAQLEINVLLLTLLKPPV